MQHIFDRLNGPQPWGTEASHWAWRENLQHKTNNDLFLFKFCALMFEILLGKLFSWYMARSALLCKGIERGTARGRKKSILKKCSGIVRISFFFSFLLFTYQMAYFQNPRTSFKSKITKRYSMGQSERH